MNTKKTVIYHRADYDGIFCREIARKFLPDAELIGWDFGDPPLNPPTGRSYVLDLPCDKPFGITFPLGCAPKKAMGFENIIWIDHHASAIASHPKNIAGYRLDGVSACRLAWQWFTGNHNDPNAIEADWHLPAKQDFLDRSVSEPLAVRLAGEYDIWDHRGDGDLEFQFGLDAQVGLDLQALLDGTDALDADTITRHIVDEGSAAMRCYAKRDGDIMRSRSFMTQFEGLPFLALNTARCNSNTFAARDVPETGHDGLLAFYWTGKDYSVSLYHAAHRKDLDLSKIAVKFGGGGHRGACGFRARKLPFIP